jgi:GNAT superfamily N-acetyltransferase
MTANIFIATTDAEIEACFPAFKELRPHLVKEEFASQVRRQQLQGYQMLALRHEGIVKSSAGFRHAEFLAWGKIIYIDDLTTLSSACGNGFAEKLLDWIIDYAKSCGCIGVHLDTGYARHNAHRLYLRKKFQLSSHHMALEF